MVSKGGRVFVRASSGLSPIPNAVVTFKDTAGGGAFSTTTNTDGTYRLELPEGRYRAWAVHSGFENHTIGQPGVTIVQAGGRVANFFLKPMPDRPGWFHTMRSPVSGADIHMGLSFAKPHLLAAGDFDGDGREELAIGSLLAGSAGNDFWVIKAGDASWRHLGAAPGRRDMIAIDASTASVPAEQIIAGDFDGDGRDELAILPDTGGSSGNDVWVVKYDTTVRKWSHFSRITGNAINASIDFAAQGIGTKFLASGDFDGDGADEIAAFPDERGSARNDVWVRKYDAGRNRWNRMGEIRGHKNGASFDCSGASEGVGQVIVGDFDGDGADEIAMRIATGGTAGNDLWVMKWDKSTGVWKHLSPIRGHSRQADVDVSGIGRPIMHLAAADLDGDGRDELIAVPEGSDDLWIMSYDPATRRWSHDTPIRNHPLGADFDPTSEPVTVEQITVGDVDMDGLPEVIMRSDDGNSRGNDLWVIGYNTLSRKYEHHSRLGYSTINASVDLSRRAEPVLKMIPLDFRSGGRTRRAEIIAGIESSGDIQLAGPNFWSVRYDKSPELITSASARLRLVIEGQRSVLNRVVDTSATNVGGQVWLRTDLQQIQLRALDPVSETFPAPPLGTNTTTVTLVGGTVGSFTPADGHISRLGAKIRFEHSIALAGASEVMVELGTRDRLPGQYGGDQGMPMDADGKFTVVGTGKFPTVSRGFYPLSGLRVWVLAEITLDRLPL